MELKLPPVIVFFVFGLLMFLLNKFLPFGFFDFFGRLVLVKLLVGMAVGILTISIVQFFRTKTTVDPGKPSKTTQLVTNGLYKFSRNPMYLGMLLMLLAWGLKLGNAFNVLLASGFVFYMNRFQIIPEEKILGNKFGKEYARYVTKTRRWF
ncbi:isoprenylcysteine carboxylmethyltransferase family protein [Maribacter sp. MJ134]|uniref:methyltransferase family protein n=1 Tax=Maribacter sp. MJ134 TaxID=2496865 RepID=UPI000F827134|nr:isoprenylcysteine carboxylmethyltransferase family protein [Maribacter sp. MJ134]AZQ57920.1 isoprenylcysteine carboxylmethyltransferase family protein [Maribacter sp. MJ134]